ncbi:hypothetical protein BDN70DRAFT_620917 [Pholiota conissans]|uniref:polynucleotide adenylyltransferase n=1 Tax=Pholiota conissans TaxID=109636 RepID=A0A9P5Z4V1_9AGAR|nr:hypothetical protein BDN70DRAFT_620917 [Pholiota conissans]
MAFTQTLSPQAMHQQYRDVHTAVTPPMQRRQASKQRFVADLSQCLFDFVIQLLPTQEEMAVKEDVRKLLERLIRTIEPDSRLLSFGSTANGFSLRNSDMDLCCLIDSEERLAATDLVTMLGDLLERETKFHVKPLPHARIPIVKLSLDPSPGLPLGIACDIGFENRLALENTRLLMCYAMIDPTRVRTMVLFLKVWSKRRKINSPYKGTLSSYGYVLLVIYFLVHVKNPPVLPNLQQMPPLRPISKEDTHLNGHNLWFFDDIDLLRQRWHSENVDTVAELLIDFFRYYSRDFSYNTGVASIRAGLLKKDSKGWQNELSSARFNDARERNRLCIEDPFETDYNVARCVTKDGLYTIRGEFMRAVRILQTRPERAIVALADLCEERKDEELVVAPPYNTRPSLPPQTPYTVGSGSQTLRPKITERFSPPAQFFEPGPRQVVQPVTLRPPPEHMAPKRGKWTSPPPPEAPSADRALFESQLGKGLQLATASTEAREKEAAYNSSESNSEVLTDDGSEAADDDLRSVRSYTEGTNNATGLVRRPSWHTPETTKPPPVFNSSASSSLSRSSSSNRNRYGRASERVDPSMPTSFRSHPEHQFTSRLDNRRSLSGLPRALRASLSSNTPIAAATPLPPSPESPMDTKCSEPSNVFYQTTTTRSPRPTALYPTHGTHLSFLSHYSSHTSFMGHPPQDIFPPNMPPALTSMNPRAAAGNSPSDRSLGGGPDTPTPATYSHLHHSHSLSNSTITALTPPPTVSKFVAPQPSPLYASHDTDAGSLPHHQGHHSPHTCSSASASPSIPASAPKALSHPNGEPKTTALKPPPQGRSPQQHSAGTSAGSSPTHSSAGYSTPISRSPSPHSLSPTSPPQTAGPIKHDDDGAAFRTSFSGMKIGSANDASDRNGLVMVHVEQVATGNKDLES